MARKLLIDDEMAQGLIDMGQLRPLYRLDEHGEKVFRILNEEERAVIYREQLKEYNERRFPTKHDTIGANESRKTVASFHDSGAVPA
jgi:hypothetical protein